MCDGKGVTTRNIRTTGPRLPAEKNMSHDTWGYHVQSLASLPNPGRTTIGYFAGSFNAIEGAANP